MDSGESSRGTLTSYRIASGQTCGHCRVVDLGIRRQDWNGLSIICIDSTYSVVDSWHSLSHSRINLNLPWTWLRITIDPAETQHLENQLHCLEQFCYAGRHRIVTHASPVTVSRAVMPWLAQPGNSRPRGCTARSISLHHRTRPDSTCRMDG